MGIGTATPDYSLHIKNIVDYAGIFLQGSDMSMIRF